MTTFILKNLRRLFDKYAVAGTEHDTLVKSTTTIFSNFVAFSENPNFTRLWMSINTELQICIIINNSSSLNHTYMRISALYKLVCREDILITPSCMKTSDGAWKTKMVECQTNIICWKGPENWRKLHFFHMVIRVFIQKRSNTWSRLIKTQYVFGRSPTKNCVTSRIMIEKASNHIETVKLSLDLWLYFSFICLKGLKTSRFNVMSQYFQQIPSAQTFCLK